MRPRTTLESEAPPTRSPVTLDWKGDLRFEACGKSGLEARLDGDGKAGLSPMEALLAALASCGASDVVEILRKGRQDLQGLQVRLSGERRAEPPRAYTRIRVRVALRGPLDPAKAERAVRLAFEKYCSVAASLDPAIPIEIELELEGSPSAGSAA